jgi:mRNA interferase MazF
MKRGEVWTAAGGPGYAGKPRPVVIVQSDAFDATKSVTICGLTTDPTEAPLARIVIDPSETNGLKATCRLMADKIMTIPRLKLDNRVGRLADADILRMNRAIVVFLGLAG